MLFAYFKENFNVPSFWGYVCNIFKTGRAVVVVKSTIAVKCVGCLLMTNFPAPTVFKIIFSLSVLFVVFLI